MDDSAPDDLERNLDYKFRNRELLERALTHKSWAFESAQGQAGGRSSVVRDSKDAAQGQAGGRSSNANVTNEKAFGDSTNENNEQLEFLGDAVLGLLVSEALVERFPHLPEGRLSKAKARFVNANHLYEAARRLDLGRFLRLGRGEEMNGGRTKRALLADSMEAIIAAVYLDGGYEAARKFVRNQVVGELEAFLPDDTSGSDFKGELQEYVQARKLPPPRYRVVSTKGPEHLKTFVIEVRVGEEWLAAAEGASKKAAGQSAAEALLKTLREVLSEGGDPPESHSAAASAKEPV